MRTTVDLPDAILRRAKAIAAMEGKSLKSFLSEAVEHELQRREESETSSKRVSLPLIASNNPGSFYLDTSKIAEILNQEDIDVFAGH